MMREIDRVEHKPRSHNKREKLPLQPGLALSTPPSTLPVSTEVADIRSKVETLLEAQASATRESVPYRPTTAARAGADRMSWCMTLSVLLNVAALIAAISVGKMLFRNDGARPHLCCSLAAHEPDRIMGNLIGLGKSGGRGVGESGSNWLSFWDTPVVINRLFLRPDTNQIGRQKLSAVQNEMCGHRLLVDWAPVGDRAIARGGGYGAGANSLFAPRTPPLGVRSARGSPREEQHPGLPAASV
eukprot:827949-Pleurochrysis_carterae.AAC.1